MTEKHLKGLITVFLEGMIIFSSFCAFRLITEGLLRLASNSPGLTYSLSLAFSSILATGVTVMLLKIKRRETKKILGLYPVGKKEVFVWLSVAVIIVILYDAFHFAFYGSIVPEKLTLLFEKSRYTILFIGTFVMITPLFEEIFFRGFLLESLSGHVRFNLFPVIVTAILWAGIHSQYGIADTAVICFIGIVFGCARIKTGSLYTCYLMHAFLNLVSALEIMVLK